MSEIINGNMIQVISQISDLIKGVGPAAFFTYLIHLIFDFLPKILTFTAILILGKWIIKAIYRSQEAYCNEGISNKLKDFEDEIEDIKIHLLPLNKFNQEYTKIFSIEIPNLKTDIQTINQNFKNLSFTQIPEIKSEIEALKVQFHSTQNKEEK